MEKHPRWFVKANGEAIPPNAIRGRTVKFESVQEAIEELDNSPRICCTTHKLDDAAWFLRVAGGSRKRDVPVWQYAINANITKAEASHTLSRLVREGRAYRTRSGYYRWRDTKGGA